MLWNKTSSRGIRLYNFGRSLVNEGLKRGQGKASSPEALVGVDMSKLAEEWRSQAGWDLEEAEWSGIRVYAKTIASS